MYELPVRVYHTSENTKLLQYLNVVSASSNLKLKNNGEVIHVKFKILLKISYITKFGSTSFFGRNFES